jgi:uncharacterized membrane protein
MSTRNKIIYWTATALMSFGMTGSGIAQLLHLEDMNEIISHLGYPLYIMYIIGVWKILGVIVILIPKFGLVKEWAYAGFFFLMSGALVSHLFMGDGGSAIFGPLFQLIFITTSWYFRPADRKITAET